MANPVIGLVGALVAAFMFAVQYTPVKSYEVHDGITFQWFLSSGSLFASILITGATGDMSMSCAGEGWLPFVGGMMFGLSNYLCIPLIQLLGMGIGFSMYHFVNIVTGYFLGRIGFLGIPASGGIVGDIGCGIIGISFIILANVEGEHESARDADLSEASATPALGSALVPDLDQTYREQYRQWRLGHWQGSSDPKVIEMLETLEAFNPMPLRLHKPLPMFRGPTPFSALTSNITRPGNDRTVSSAAATTTHISSGLTVSSTPCLQSLATDPLIVPNTIPQERPRRYLKTFIGIMLALATGVLTGSCATPSIKYNLDHPGKPFAALLAMSLGFWFCGTVIYVVYTTGARIRGIKVPHAPIRPSFVCGALWAVGNALNIFNPTQIAYTVSYAVAIVGCLIIAGLISLFFYKEIVGTKKIVMFCVALVMQGIGVISICLAGTN